MGYKIKRIYQGTNLVRPPLPVPKSGLLGYRPLEQNLNDMSGNGNNGSWYSGTGSFSAIGGKTGARVTTQLVSGRTVTAQHIVTSLQYDGSNISMCGWIYYATQVSDGLRPGIINNSPSTNNTTMYMIGQRVFDSWNTYLMKSSSTVYKLGDRINTGGWNFVCVTVNGTTAKYYLNGVLKNTITITSGNTTNNYWRLGCGPYDSTAGLGGTDGYVRHCAVYNRALTDAEVSQFYNQTS